MAIDELLRVVPPPHPTHSGTADKLDAVERQLGIRLPSDFRELAIRYGSGCFFGPDIPEDDGSSIGMICKIDRQQTTGYDLTREVKHATHDP